MDNHKNNLTLRGVRWVVIAEIMGDAPLVEVKVTQNLEVWLSNSQGEQQAVCCILVSKANRINEGST